MDRSKYAKKSKRHKQKIANRATSSITPSSIIQNKKTPVQDEHHTRSSGGVNEEAALPMNIKSNTIHVSRPQIDNNNNNNNLAAEQVRVIHRLPPPFPASMIRPEKGFLRNLPPYEKSFQCALTTSYEGFVVDMDVVPDEHHIQKTLQSDEMEPYFVTDITQPFGLGTACAPTYVTRCLMGDSGTTYKYLGLRMFAHSWNTPIRELKDLLSSRVTNQHLPQLYRHRQHTIATTTDSATCASTNLTYQPSSTKPCFDICLINRMTMNEKLKTEPLDEEHKTTVSWHADSSLEHYSTIAVYQTIVPANNNNNNNNNMQHQKHHVNTSSTENEWSIGLRVSPNAEGPKINHSRINDTTTSTSNGNAHADTAVVVAPPIAVSLPTNSAYYLLDDFNHHHQHTVLVNKHKSSLVSSTRYSLTFRLLRDSHNINDMIARCQRCVSQFHKKGTKTYRFEQLTLNELESEWLRQFYIQGRHHHQVLWYEWSDDMTKLWGYWNQLENRTFLTIQMLRYAAQGRCYNKDIVQSPTSQVSDKNGEDQGTVNSNLERKVRAKRKKAVSAMIELLTRESASTKLTSNGDSTTTTSLYELYATALDERATMRELWLSREADPVFKKLKPQFRPIPFPVKFHVTENADVRTNTAQSNANNMEEAPVSIDPHQVPMGMSPMPGTSAELRNLANTIRAWGQAFSSSDSHDLPQANPLDQLHPDKTATTDEKMPVKRNAIPITSEDKAVLAGFALHWDGWKRYTFGLEMQCPWSSALLDGRKTIETRRYEIPPTLLGQKVYIIETPVGKDGVSGILGDDFQNCGSHTANPNHICKSNQWPKIVGWCIFSEVKQYQTQQDFSMDEKHHLVPSNSTYGWQNGDTDVLYGWVVSQRGRNCEVFYSSGVRRYRSLFQLALFNENLKVKNEASRPSTSKFPIITEHKKSTKKSNSQVRRNNQTLSSASVSPRKKRRF